MRNSDCNQITSNNDACSDNEMSLGVIYNNDILLLRQVIFLVKRIDNLVNGSSTGMCLKWVTENDENHNGQSSISDEMRLRVYVEFWDLLVCVHNSRLCRSVSFKNLHIKMILPKTSFPKLR